MKVTTSILFLVAVLGFCQAGIWGGYGGYSSGWGGGWNSGWGGSGYRTVKVVRVVPSYSSGYYSSPWRSGWNSGWRSGWW
ncbi:protein suex-1-like [Diabrotica virgifera virgifera]|uniref:Uncharacterized protein F12A10.7-like n=1 Tax=Diabrotica virgifera virgifera TaxID=50390 RepID=A0A6P7FXA3_DIAVI|nr:protein suex-1-like [Diabrotica virgifera virgifera]